MTPSSRTETNHVPTCLPATDGVVLVVDDDPVIREVVRAMLMHAGRKPLVAETPDEAVALAGDPANRVAVVLSDLQMPGVEGWELFARLRRAAPQAAIVAMTGLTGSFPPGDLAAAGVVRVLAKPFTAGQLMKAVE